MNKNENFPTSSTITSPQNEQELDAFPDALANESESVAALSDADQKISQGETAQPKTKKKAFTNAEKQKRYRERQKARGKQEMRGYLSPEAKECYRLIAEQTNWSDSIILSNAVRLTYAAYKNGQIGLLNNWLNKNKL